MTGKFSMPGAFRRLLPWAILSAAVFIFYGRILSGEILFSSDSLSYQMPEKFLIRECFLDGTFPWINPYILCGEPMLPNIDSAILYPLNIFLLFGENLFGYSLFVFVHYLLAAFAMYILLRKGFAYYMSVSLCGALAYSCGGYLWSMNGNGFYRCAWLIPLFFLFLLKLYRSKETRFRIRYIILSAFALALLFLCGNFYESYFAICFAFAAVLFALPKSIKERGFSVIPKAGWLFLLLIAFAVIMALPQLVAAYKASCLSSRAGGVPYDEASLWSFPPLRLIEYIAPFFFGTRQGNGLMSSLLYYVPEHLKWQNIAFSPWADAVFIGTPMLLFLCSAIFSIKRGWRYYFIFSAITFSLLMALGKYTPLFYFTRDILPGFNMFRHPEKFIFWFNFFLLIASCAGLQAILRGAKKAWKFFRISCLIFLAGTLPGAAYFLFSGETGAILRWRIIALLFPCAIAAVTFFWCRRGKVSGMAIAGMLYFQALTYSLFVIWTVPEQCFKDTISWVNCLGKFDRSNWRIMPCEVMTKPLLVPEADEKTMRIFAEDPYIAKQFAFVSSLKYNAPVLFHLRSMLGFSPLCAKSYIDFLDFSRNNPSAVADAVSARYISAAGKPGKLPAANRISVTLPSGKEGKFISILENTNAHRRAEALSPGGKYDYNLAAVITDDLPGRIAVRVKGPALLVLRDRFDKGWSCTDSKGKKREIIPFDKIFMSVNCPETDGKLLFTYSPPEAALFQYSLCTALVMLLALSITFRGKKRS
ncbi:MAG: hypothetical protein A2017_08115 [Lentisphaerae bacterium GWF2_44_16]|nr:MAG: hypothetical protein A2017_08115 [Lentisphaerae bacterium GWF2_44_16]